MIKDLEVHLDYFSCTMSASRSIQEGIEFEAFAQGFLPAGIDWSMGRVASRMGYRGKAVDSSFLGLGPIGMWLVVSGPEAERGLDAVLPSGARVTRVDIALTVRLESDSPTMAREVRQQAMRHRRKIDERHREQVTFYTSTGGGETVYLGAPSSDRRLRVYDKWRESGDDSFKHCWRFELQYRHERAEQIFRGAQAASDRKAALSGTVLAHVAEREIDVLGGLRISDLVHTSIPRRPDDAAKKLAWLSTSVKPAVKRLLTVYDREVILMALGLSQSSQESSDHFS